MVESIVLSGVAIGCIYALIGITYNVMFSASRVFSFTAGTLGMLGGVLGSLFIAAWECRWRSASCSRWPAASLLRRRHRDRRRAAGAEEPRPASLRAVHPRAGADGPAVHRDRVEHRGAQPFPRLLDIARGGFDQQFWLPMLACLAVIVGLELLYRHTLIGRAFLAIAEDTYAARALGLPERSLRMTSFALAGVIGALAGFAGGEMLLAFFGNAPLLTFYGFVPVALGGMGNNRGAVVAGLLLGLFQQTANFLVGGIFASVAVFTVFIIVLLARPEGLAGAALQRRV